MTETREPLKALSVDPPSLDAASSTGYTVTVALSRALTRSETAAISDITDRAMRGYGSTLEIYRTTIEDVSDQVGHINEVLKQAESEGRKVDEVAEARQRAREKAEQARVAEEERLRQLAESITFD